MSKKGKLYIVLTAFVILLIVFLEATKPQPINWFPSYATHHKIPFGSYVFESQLDRLADSLIAVDRPPFEYLRKNFIEGAYVFYNGGINFGEDELETLLDWTSKGNTLMIAAVNFETRLLDTLNLSTAAISTFDNFNNEYQVQLTNPSLYKGVTYKVYKAQTLFYFDEIDTLKTKVIGIVDKYNSGIERISDSLVNVIKQPFGDGSIILSTFPQTFTNHFILNAPNQNYTAGVLSYLDMKRPIYLDNHYKSGKKFYTSPMYLFLSNPNLKWAYYIALIGVLVYIIFEGKRKQRAIPIIQPLTNKTIDFTRTISDMYYQSSKHKEIVEHKIQHFLEYIRNTLHLQTSEINSIFLNNLASRSNNSIEETETLFNYIKTLRGLTTINNIQLERLNSLLETFKSHNTWKTK